MPGGTVAIWDVEGTDRRQRDFGYRMRGAELAVTSRLWLNQVYHIWTDVNLAQGNSKLAPIQLLRSASIVWSRMWRRTKVRGGN